MPISLLTNLAALTALPHLEQANQRYTRASERLASGQRINHPSDDAAGLARATKLEGEIRSAEQAKRNANEGLAIVQIAEGGLAQSNNILMRMRELAVQGANDSTSEKERELLAVEMNELVSELERLSENVQFSGTQLINGSGRTYEFQIGTGNTEYDRLSFDTSTVDARPDSMGVDDLSISDPSDAQDSIESISEALEHVQLARANMGAVQSRIHYVIDQLQTYGTNVTGMKSGILDADMAVETTELVASQIQQHSAMSVLTQANLFPQLALRLIDAIGRY